MGPFGRFQRVFYFLLCLLPIFTMFVTMAPAFVAATPKHRCKIPDCDSTDPKYEDAFDKNFSTFTIPLKKQTWVKKAM